MCIQYIILKYNNIMYNIISVQGRHRGKKSNSANIFVIYNILIIWDAHDCCSVGSKLLLNSRNCII